MIAVLAEHESRFTVLTGIRQGKSCDGIELFVIDFFDPVSHPVRNFRSRRGTEQGGKHKRRELPTVHLCSSWAQSTTGTTCTSSAY